MLLCYVVKGDKPIPLPNNNLVITEFIQHLNLNMCFVRRSRIEVVDSSLKTSPPPL